MGEVNNDKMYRVLGLYSKLMKWDMIYKPEEALYYGVNERSIQRDIVNVYYYTTRIYNVAILSY